MKIVFPTDGSESSLAALHHLIPRLRWFAEAPQIAVVYVHLPLPYARAVAWAGKEAVHRYYEEESNAILATAASVLTQGGVPFEQAMRVGEPAHEILHFAGEWHADLIAMGRKGQGAIAAILLGSVAQKVIAASTVPVLLVH